MVLSGSNNIVSGLYSGSVGHNNNISGCYTYAIGYAITASCHNNVYLADCINIKCVPAGTATKGLGVNSSGFVISGLIPAALQTVTSAATVTPNANTDEIVVVTAQAVGLTIANPSGTPFQGQVVVVRVRDNSTPQTIAYGASLVAFGAALPTTTISNKTTYFTLIYNANTTKWDTSSTTEI